MLRCVSLDWARQQRLSLDTLVQMALQMGYRAVRGRVDSTYEACSTNNFVCGRTETIRSVTPQSVALCEALARGEADVPTQLSLLQAALDAHRTTVRACQAAHGHERHLLALRFQAVDLGRPTPALFSDGGYAAVSNSVLSTSGLRSPSLELFCFGPVVETGLGFGYVLKPDGVLLSVTSWRGKGPPAAEVSAALETTSSLSARSTQRTADGRTRCPSTCRPWLTRGRWTRGSSTFTNP